jgi:hypothetical protein
VIASEVGHLELAHDYLASAALFGLHDAATVRASSPDSAV